MEARGENSEPEKRDLDQIIEDLKQTPIFMDEITEDAARNNPAVCALLELMKDSSPEEQFYTLKSHGDECFSGGSEYYKASKSHYLKALGINAGLPEHRACVYRNLAVAENLLGNHGSAIKHCLQVLKIFPKDPQSLYNLALAHTKLERYDEAEKALIVILSESKSAKNLAEIIKEKREQALERKSADEKRGRREIIEQKKLIQRIKDSKARIISSSVKRSEFEVYLEALRGITYNGIEVKVTHDPGQDRLYWPVILYYPEHKISELIAKFDEESTFNDHLSVMFDDERAPWDEKYNYNNRAIIVFFEHRSRGLPHTRKPRIRKVNKADCLRKILQDPEMAIVDGCATFLLLSRNSPFYETALRNYEVA